MEAIIPAGYKGHVIEVARLGVAFSITHTCNGKLIYTSTYDKELDALRVSAELGDNLVKEGEEVCLNIKTHIVCPL